MARNRSGFALIEVMVASVIMFIVFAALISLWSIFLNQSQAVRVMSKRDQQIASMIETIRSGAKNFQIDYTGAATTLDINNLPIAWDETAWGPASSPDFSGLPGRAGFTIKPLEQNAKILVVSLTVRHPSMKESQKVITFLASASE